MNELSTRINNLSFSSDLFVNCVVCNNKYPASDGDVMYQTCNVPHTMPDLVDYIALSSTPMKEGVDYDVFCIVDHASVYDANCAESELDDDEKDLSVAPHALYLMAEEYSWSEDRQEYDEWYLARLIDGEFQRLNGTYMGGQDFHLEFEGDVKYIQRMLNGLLVSNLCVRTIVPKAPEPEESVPKDTEMSEN